jgi:hypothetical protein
VNIQPAPRKTRSYRKPWTPAEKEERRVEMAENKESWQRVIDEAKARHPVRDYTYRPRTYYYYYPQRRTLYGVFMVGW